MNASSPRTRANRRWLVPALLVNLLALPLSALFLVVALGHLNPMITAFLTEFELRNKSAERVWVTPIGATDRGPDRVLLPTYESTSWASQRRLPHRDAELVPGASLRVTYDWDDCVLSEVLVRRSDGSVLSLRVREWGPNGLREIRCADDDLVVIDRLDRLPTAEAHELAALRPVEGLWLPPAAVLAIGPFVHLLTLVCALVRIRRGSRPGATPGAGLATVS